MTSSRSLISLTNNATPFLAYGFTNAVTGTAADSVNGYSEGRKTVRKSMWNESDG